jgi:hypothetical protein
MSQRNVFILCLFLTIFACTPFSRAQKGKFEFSAGMGCFSGYSFANKAQNGAAYATSSGVANFAGRYYLSKNVTLGLNISYENISTWATFFTVAPEVSVAYLDTRDANTRVKLYGAASFGISVLSDNVLGRGEADESGPKAWGGQITPFGVRLGRQFAVFTEIGFGYKGLVNGGLALRVPRRLHHHREQVVD